MDTNKYRITRIIHWAMAVLVIGLLMLGFYMKTFEAFNFYDLHKSFGVVALMAMMLRLYWRYKSPWPSSSVGTKHERIVHIAHLGLLILVLLMSITGLMLSGLGGYGVALFGIELIPENFNADGEVVPFNNALSSFAYLAHEVLAYGLAALLGGHIGAVIKHQFYNKNHTLRRMLRGPESV